LQLLLNEESVGTARAEASAPRLKELNERVEVRVATGTSPLPLSLSPVERLSEPYSDAQLRIVTIRVWHGATENGP
jgi:molybdopterin/thiamine biosynthesis adenylyltransferase